MASALGKSIFTVESELMEDFYLGSLAPRAHPEKASVQFYDLNDLYDLSVQIVQVVQLYGGSSEQNNFDRTFVRIVLLYDLPYNSYNLRTLVRSVQFRPSMVRSLGKCIRNL